MSSRFARILLLLSVAYWATNAGQFVHEMTEHAGHAAARVAHPSRGVSVSAGATVDDDHDNCQICQMLAHMSAPAATMAMPVGFELPAVATLSVSSQRAPLIFSHFAGSIRGPPVLV